MPNRKRIAINTGGGDAPGLNAVIETIRGVPLEGDTVQTARDLGFCFGHRKD